MLTLNTSTGTLLSMQRIVNLQSGAVTPTDKGGKPAPVSWWAKTFTWGALLSGALLFIAAAIVPFFLTVSQGWLWSESLIMSGLLLSGAFLAFQCPQMWADTAGTLNVFFAVLKGKKVTPNWHTPNSVLHAYRRILDGAVPTHEEEDEEDEPDEEPVSPPPSPSQTVIFPEVQQPLLP